MGAPGITFRARDTTDLPTFLGEHTRPACQEPDVDPEWWFPLTQYSGPRVDRARKICRGCPLLEPCGEWAAARGEQWGIWGGLDPVQLAARRQQRQAAADGRMEAWLAARLPGWST